MNNAKGQCVYNANWECDPMYRDWVKSVKTDKRKALCSYCDKMIDISTMGKSALNSRIWGTPWKTMKCPWKVLEKSLNLVSCTLYEPWKYCVSVPEHVNKPDGSIEKEYGNAPEFICIFLFFSSYILYVLICAWKDVRATIQWTSLSPHNMVNDPLKVSTKH